MGEQVLVDAADNYTGKLNLARTEQGLANYNRWIISLFMAHLPKDRPLRVLDFGGGIGTLSVLMREIEGVSVDGVEADIEQRALFAARGFKVFKRLDEVDQTYDVIFTSNVLEHIEDDVGILEGFHARLKPGGVLLVYVPAFELIWTRMDDMVGHLRRYRAADLTRKIQQSGFSLSHISYRDCVGFFMALVFRLIHSGNGEISVGSLLIFDRFLLPISRLGDLVFSRILGKNVFAVAVKPL